MKTSDLFIKILEQKWVEVIYGVPGEENLDLLDSIWNSSIELILTRNEQTAVFMAANYWRFTGKPGVALATLWPGATNMMTWVAYAQLWWMPLIVITWQKPQNKSKQWAFQIIDAVSMMKPVTKYAVSIVNGARVPYILENAFNIAQSEKPWAVHLELPEDIAAEDVEEQYSIINLHTQKQRRPVVDRKWVSVLIEEISKAKSPIILIGSWANRKRVSKYLTQFIEKYNIPFFCSQMGKWVVNETLPQYLWTAALTSWDYIHDAIGKSDLIISVWYDNVEKPTDILWINGTPVININFVESNYDFVYSPYMDLIWDIGNLFWHLCEAEIKENWNFDEIYKINQKNHEKIHNNCKLEKDIPYMMPRKLVSDLQDTLSPKDILALDNGLYKVWIARNFKAQYPNTVLLDNALATMWAGYATAMEAKRLNPNQNVVCITWDGWLVMNLWDLETIVRMKLDITIVVLNNSSYWMIKWKQAWAHLKDFWLDFWNPDFVKLAESFWARWYKVEKKEDFKKILWLTLKEKWLKIIDLDFDYPVDGKIS